MLAATSEVASELFAIISNGKKVSTSFSKRLAIYSLGFDVLWAGASEQSASVGECSNSTSEPLAGTNQNKEQSQRMAG